MFFYGTSKRENCGIGGIIIILDSHKVIFKADSGRGFDNKAEGLAVRTLLKLALEEDIRELTVCGDSKLWVENLNERKNLMNANLQVMGANLKKLEGAFSSLRICLFFQRTKHAIKSSF